jgi:hypothetical protein
MIKSNLRDLLTSGENRHTQQKASNIREAFRAFVQARTMTLDTFATFAEVLEQNTVPLAFRSEILPVLLEGAKLGQMRDAAEVARDRAMVRLSLDYDWAETPEEPTPQVPLFRTGLNGLAARESTGFGEAPARYTQRPDGRETIDHIRDMLGDQRFLAYCEGNVLKYRDRAGAKGDAKGDAEKAKWYEEMVRHLKNPGANPDPRTYRKTGSTNYAR